MEKIYYDPKRYAELVSCSMEIAEKRCAYYIELNNKADRAKICPVCGNSSLFITVPDLENHCFDGKVLCQKCDFESNVTEEFSILQLMDCWFDLVLFSYKCKDFFSDTWDDFVAKDTEMLFQATVD